MQAELPDKNTAFIVYRREAISNFKSEKYDSCIGALKSLMGLLPSDYRPTISTEDYEALTDRGLIGVCTECNIQVSMPSVKTYQRLLPYFASVVSNKQTEEVWDCTECGKTNNLATTKFIQKVLKEPYFPKIIPKPPGRSHGMLGRTQFKIKFSDWFWDKALPTIEAQMGRYREEYQPKDMDLYEIDNGIDGGET